MVKKRGREEGRKEKETGGLQAGRGWDEFEEFRLVQIGDGEVFPVFRDGGSDDSGAEAKFHFEQFFPTVLVGVDSPDAHASGAFPDDQASRGGECDGGRGGEKAGGEVAHPSRMGGFKCGEGLGLGGASQGGRKGR